MQYIIYESAMTPEISNVKKLAGVVEFTTVLQEADAKNRNGRIYPKAVIDAAIHAPLVNEKMRTHTWFGECGHPFSTEISRQTNVVMTNAAFRIDEVWWEGNLLKGRCQTLNTSLGRDMAGLIEQGSQLSFSMRGQGNVARDPARDALVVQSPLALITFDWVWIPSHEVAYMDQISEETNNCMFNYNSYSDKQMALTESLNLYENGAMIEVQQEAPKEKPVKDYYVNYGKSIKTLEETYVFDKNDTVKEINEKFVILESADCLKKVARNDYILKSIRSGITECCAGIAPLDCRYGNVTRPLTPEDQQPDMNVDNDTVLKTLDSSEDVPSEKYENPVEHEVKEKLGDEPKNVSASLTEAQKVDENGNPVKKSHKGLVGLLIGAGLTAAAAAAICAHRPELAQQIADGVSGALEKGKAFAKTAGKAVAEKASEVAKGASEVASEVGSKVAEGAKVAGAKAAEVGSEAVKHGESLVKKGKEVAKKVVLKEEKEDSEEDEELEKKDEALEEVEEKDEKECKDEKCEEKESEELEDKDEKEESEEEDDDDEKSEDKEDDSEDESDEDEEEEDEKDKALKEEFYKYYDLIKEETKLTRQEDIIACGAKYAEYMSESCAYLFKSLNEKKDGE